MPRTFKTLLTSVPYTVHIGSRLLIIHCDSSSPSSPLQRPFCTLCVCVFVCVVPFILDVRSVDVPAGVTKEEGHTGFLCLPSAVLALIFLARRIQPFLSLVDREDEVVY